MTASEQRDTERRLGVWDGDTETAFEVREGASPITSGPRIASLSSSSASPKCGQADRLTFGKAAPSRRRREQCVFGLAGAA